MLIRKPFPAQRKVSLKSPWPVIRRFLIKYPPGIPLVVPGEVIDEPILEILKNNISQYKIEDGITVVKE